MIRSPRWRLLRTALLLALCSVALTGCFRIEVALRVHEDGSGVVSIVTAVEDSFIRLMGQLSDDDLGDLFDFENLPPGAVVEAHQQDGFTGRRISVEVSDMEQLPQVLGAFDLTNETVGGVELKREDEGWRFEVLMPALGEELAETSGLGGGGSFDELASFLESASYTVRLALPGELIDHNADRVEDDELVWELDLTSEQPRLLSASSQPKGGLDDWAIMAIALAGGAALIAVVGYLALRSRRAA